MPSFVAKADSGDKAADDDDDDEEDLDEDQKASRKIAAAWLALRTSLLLRVSSATTAAEARRRIRLITGSRYADAVEAAFSVAIADYTAPNRERADHKGDLSEDHRAIIREAILAVANDLATNDRAAARAAINGAKPENFRTRLAETIAKISSFDDAGKLASKIRAISILRTIVTTTFHAASNDVLLRTYADAGVEYVRWVCEIDPCPICEPGDGVVYRIGTDCPGVGEPAPPAHMNCRCYVVPAQKSEM